LGAVTEWEGRGERVRALLGVAGLPLVVGAAVLALALVVTERVTVLPLVTGRPVGRRRLGLGGRIIGLFLRRKQNCGPVMAATMIERRLGLTLSTRRKDPLLPWKPIAERAYWLTGGCS